MTTCDLAIIGLGAVGSAALLAAARAGVDVVGIDRFSPPHTFGSTHGETRIVRAGIGEGAGYCRLALRSFDLWDQLAAETGETLVNRCGGLILANGLSHAPADFLERSIAAARQHAIPHEVLSPFEVRRRFPAFLAFHGDQAYYEPGAGMAFPERIVAAQLSRAQALGARTELHTTVTSITQASGRVRITHRDGAIEAQRAVLCAGAWTPGFLPETWSSSLRVLRQTMHWFDVAQPEIHEPSAMPVFIWGETYGFPLAGGPSGGLKVATEDMAALVDPDAVPRRVTRADIARIEAAVRPLLHMLGPHRRGTSCLYTFAPNGDFRIGPHPEMDRLTVVSACSGHGFKHSAAVGEAAALDPASLAEWRWP